jgi:hypothetical protein
VATSIRKTVTNFKVVQLVPIFRLLLNKTRFTLQLSRPRHGGREEDNLGYLVGLPLFHRRVDRPGTGIPISWRDGRGPQWSNMGLGPSLAFSMLSSWPEGEGRGKGRGLRPSWGGGCHGVEEGAPRLLVAFWSD